MLCYVYGSASLGAWEVLACVLDRYSCSSSLYMYMRFYAVYANCYRYNVVFLSFSGSGFHLLSVTSLVLVFIMAGRDCRSFPP